MHPRITALFAAIDSADSPIPANELYNKRWLLRLVFDWFFAHRDTDHPLTPMPAARWRTDARVPSHLQDASIAVDGLLGHFDLAEAPSGTVVARADAQQLVAIQSTLGGSASASIDQSARTVAGIAEMLFRAKRPAGRIAQLSFFFLAPQAQIDAGGLSSFVDRDAVRAKVAQEAGEQWLAEAFDPALERLDLELFAWESIVGRIDMRDPESKLERFYERCRST